jgi:hypothetical protein
MQTTLGATSISKEKATCRLLERIIIEEYDQEVQDGAQGDQNGEAEFEAQGQDSSRERA